LRAGRDLKAAFEMAHRHDAILDRHFMDLSLLRNVAGDGYEAVRRAAGVDDGHISAGDAGTGRRLARPRMVDLEITDLEIVRQYRMGAGEGQGEGEDGETD